MSRREAALSSADRWTWLGPRWSVGLWFVAHRMHVDNAFGGSESGGRLQRNAKKSHRNLRLRTMVDIGKSPHIGAQFHNREEKCPDC
jgi:hypothetical protein